ncbi:hypothetical protein C8R44DRAFT_767145 [Mycena epipterygia]|nr:hypothetical protein C8R44DRAFT_767145 [Mycena epipterygia]
MGNPVDDSPIGLGLPLDPADPHSTADAGARLRKFRRRALYIFAVCFTLVLVKFWEHRPRIGGPIGEFTHEAVNIAQDLRLVPHQTPETAEYCAEWERVVDQVSETAQHLASAAFELPTADDLIFFLSRGPVSGHIHIDRTTNYELGPIRVNITAEYHDAEDLERTKVCRMGLENEHGVLVWAEPRHLHDAPRRDVRINMTVVFPAGVRRFNDLTTDLALFQHSIGNFLDGNWAPASFAAIRLKTSNVAINHGSLAGIRAGFIQTSNAKVEGFFTGIGDLSVQTSNAPIVSTALMFGVSAGSESRVTLRTSNGAITANMGMVGDYKDSVLRAVVQTSNASLTIGPITQRWSQNTRLLIDASTTVGSAIVSLEPEYEGTYDLQTSLARAQVEAHWVIDPSGQGRNRTVIERGTGHHAQGSIYWTHDGEPNEGVRSGFVKVTTSQSPITLYC